MSLTDTNEFKDIVQRLDKIADELLQLVKPTKSELIDAELTITDSGDDIENYATMEWHLGKINMLLNVIDNRDMDEDLAED